MSNDPTNATPATDAADTNADAGATQANAAGGAPDANAAANASPPNPPVVQPAAAGCVLAGNKTVKVITAIVLAALAALLILAIAQVISSTATNAALGDINQTLKGIGTHLGVPADEGDADDEDADAATGEGESEENAEQAQADPAQSKKPKPNQAAAADDADDADDADENADEAAADSHDAACTVVNGKKRVASHFSTAHTAQGEAIAKAKAALEEAETLHAQMSPIRAYLDEDARISEETHKQQKAALDAVGADDDVK